MNDLEIRTRIADIEGVVYEVITNESGYKWLKVECTKFITGYDPLTDDALIFTLAFSNKAKIDYFDECVYIVSHRKLSRHRFDKDDIASLRRAICLAKIEAHKDD